MGKRHVVAVGLLCLVLAGCARSDSASSSSPGASAGTPAPTPGGSSPSGGSPGTLPPDQSPPPGYPPSGGTRQLVLSGQVESGVEPGCLILRDAGKTYELMGGDPAIVKAGARVRVVGHLAVGVMSHCMQGQPFQVTEAHAL